MSLTDAMDNFHQAAEEAMRQETLIHEERARTLLNKNGVKYLITAATPASALEREGYYMEHRVLPDKDGEIHEWRLYQLVDSSPRYKIQRVIAIEDVS